MNKAQNKAVSKGSPLAILSNGLLLLCGLVGLVRTFLSLYPTLLSHLAGSLELVTSSFFVSRGQLATAAQLEALPLQLTLWAVILAVVVLAVWSLPRFRAVAVTLLAVLLFAVGFRYRLYLAEGMREIAAAVINPAAQHFRLDSLRFSYDLQPADRFTGAVLFLGGALAVIALLLGWAVVRVQRWWIAVALTLLPILPALLTNAYPHWGWFILLMAFWLTMLLGSLCRNSPGRGAFTLISLPVTGLLLAAVVTILPQERYEYPKWAYNAWETVSSAVGQLGASLDTGIIELPGLTSGSGIRMDEVDLTKAGPLDYSGETVFEITGNYSGRVYLRGGSLAVYTGESWEPLAEGDYDYGSSYSPLLFPAQLGSAGKERSIVINNVSARTKNTFLPYQLADQSFRQMGLSLVEDSAVVSNASRRLIEISFLPDALDLSQFVPSDDPDFLAARAEYTEFVMEHYTQTDSKLLPLINYPVSTIPTDDGYVLYGPVIGSGLINTNLGDTDNSYLRAVNTVTAWLAAQCVYDPDTPVTPDGEDFAEYFLTTGRGYCVHFATAATLLLREMGVPARYVSGYVADPRSGQTVEVPDSAAHAWVEVYLPSYGWYPVEVTPGYNFEGPEVEDEPEESPSPSPSPTQSERPAKELPTVTPSASPSPSVTPGVSGNGTGGLLSALLSLLKWAGGIAAAVLLLWLGQYLPKRRREKILRQAVSNQAVLACYGWLTRLTRWGGMVDPTALELAQKARFSQHTLSKEERVMMAVLFHDERCRIGGRLAPIPRLVFRYIWGVPKN